MKRTGSYLFISILFAVSACGDACQEIDQDEINCTQDAQCDDGLYCNGFEVCAPDHPLASQYGCVRGVACARSVTLESNGTISCTYREQEEQIAECFDDGGDEATCCRDTCFIDGDCSDGIFCNGQETCDPNSPLSTERGCVQGAPPCDEGTSCNEETTMCVAGCVDSDGDGYESVSCGGDDCDDSDAGISPGSPEVCDAEGVDEDCDATTIGVDQDGDGYVSALCCNGDECGGDCNDVAPGVFPLAAEVCNGLDDNCDGDIDEMVRQAFYADTDGDGFGDASSVQMGCESTIGSGYSPNPGDCDDTNPQIFPGSIVCDPQPNMPTAYQYCETDGTFSTGACDPQTEACIEQPGGHGVCSRP